MLAQRVDLAGWHAVYLPDHFMPHHSDGVALDGPVLECWSTLSAVATQTDRIRLGSLVLGNTYRHPAVVANMAATLDRVSGARVVLGIGAGWQPNEHTAYGIARPGARERIDALDEACWVIRTLLDRRRSTITGQRYRLRDAPCDPKPLQSRLPLLVGGGGEQRTLRVAARHADVWHTWADPAVFSHKNVVLTRHCADIGRDPTDISRATGGTVAVWPTRRSAHDGVESDVQGVTDDVLEQLLEFRLSGADEFIVRDDATNVPVDRALALIDHLSEAVIPRLVS
jgi:alkanesulfonate monooxygenase SsuD/methylene tetrahydromethanopterin reductase-like flavin-dependent oxidoreductase (luciferase family)